MTASAVSLFHLATTTGWSPWLAWVLPVSVDMYAFVATRLWLQPNTPTNVRLWARRSGWTAIGLSIAGNAVDHALRTGHWMVGGVGGPEPHIVIVVVVGSIPPVMAGLIVHLRSLRPVTSIDDARVERTQLVEVEPADDASLAPPGRSEVVTLEPPANRQRGEVTKRRALLELLAREVPLGDDRSAYQLGQHFGPQVGLHQATAVRHAREFLAERAEVSTADAPLQAVGQASGEGA